MERMRKETVLLQARSGDRAQMPPSRLRGCNFQGHVRGLCLGTFHRRCLNSAEIPDNLPAFGELELERIDQYR